MTEVTQRELEKIRTDIHNLRDRFSLMLSRAGGHINGQIDLEGWLQLDERAAPSQPAADHGRLYAKSDGLIYWQDDGGSEHDLTAGGGGDGAPEGADYLVLTLNATLTGERRFVPGTGLDAVDGGANEDYTLSVDPSEISHDDLLDVSADDHHNRLHALNSASDHSASGLSVGQVLRATGATTFAWAELQHDDLGGVSADQHHNQVHVITGADHTVTGSQWDLVGLTGTNTLGLLTPSDDPGYTAKILKTNTSGILSLVRLDVDTIHDEAGGNLTLLPAGDIILDPTGFDVLPGAGYEVNLGMLSKKYLTLHAAELWVETLVAQDTLATIGGRVLVGPTTMLASDVDTDDVILYFEHNQMTSGDVVLLEAAGKLEFMRINSSPSGTGPYAYSMVRNLDGTGANLWYAGDAVFNTGAAGDGFIDLYSVHAVNVAGNHGPTIVGNVRNGATYNDWTEHWAIGNLDGLYGYGTDIYGVGLGEYGGEYVTIEATNGIRMYSDGSQRVQIATDGSFWFGDSISTERLAWDPTNGLRIFDAGNDAVISLDTAGNAYIAGDALVDGSVTATKFLVGDSGIFSDDGLLLLGPGCELTATSWKSLRGQEATIANAFQTMRGTFPGTQGIVMEPGCTNIVENPSAGVNVTDWWTGFSHSTGARDTTDYKFDGACFKMTGDGGGYPSLGRTGAVANPAQDAVYYLSAWVRAPASVIGQDARLVINERGGAQGTASTSEDFTLTGRWQRIWITRTIVEADRTALDIYVALLDDTADRYIWIDGVQLEVTRLTTPCIGSMAWCAWTGTAHDSTSTRTGTTYTIPVDGQIGVATGSISVRFRLNDAYNPTGGFLFSAGNANQEFDAHVDSSGTLNYRINSATRCSIADVSLDQDHHAVFTWSIAADESQLFLDGVLVDEGTCGGGAWTKGTSIGIGYHPSLPVNSNLCGTITEFAVFVDLLSKDEVAALWNLKEPLVDHGATDSPGIYIVDGKFRMSSSTSGSRIEITPDEIAGYSGATKQFYLQAEDGKAYAGGGVVGLDDDGIKITASTVYADLRSYKFVDSGGTVLSRITSFKDGTCNDICVEAYPSSGINSWARLQAKSAHGVRAVSSIYAEHDAAQYAYWIADIDDAYGSAIWWVVDEAQMGEFKKDHSHIVLDGTAVVGTNVDVQADWELTYSTSVRAAKTNIRDFMADRQVFMDLKPTIYNAIEAPSGPPIIGLIAEDVAETLPGLATFLDKRGLSRSRPKGEPPELELVGWDDKQMLVTMISVVQQQEQDLTALEARVAMLESA